MENTLLLIIAHAIGDFGLQNEWTVRKKMEGNLIFLTGHSIIHGGLIYILTNSLNLTLIIFVTHLIIDHLKVKGKYGELTDQILHLTVILLI